MNSREVMNIVIIYEETRIRLSIMYTCTFHR